MSVEDKYKDSICIVYPATLVLDDGSKLPVDASINLHCTINFLGDVNDVHFTKEDLEEVLNSFTFEDDRIVKTGKMRLFGSEKSFLVVTINDEALVNEANAVNALLDAKGFINKDVPRFPQYLPHVTIREDYTGNNVRQMKSPSHVKLGHPTVWWGSERG